MSTDGTTGPGPTHTGPTHSGPTQPGPAGDSAKGTSKSAKRQEIVEQIEVAGDQLVSKVKELVAEGGAKRIVLRSSEGKELFSLPLTVGVAAGGVVTLAAPLLAAIGAVAALVSHVQLEIVRTDESAEPPVGSGPTGSGPAGPGPAGSGPAGSGPAGLGPTGTGPTVTGSAPQGPPASGSSNQP